MEPVAHRRLRLVNQTALLQAIKSSTKRAFSAYVVAMGQYYEWRICTEERHIE